jgi:hypothetical protein
VLPLSGKYAVYDLLGDGTSIDFTIDEFIYRRDEIYSFLDDKNLRSIFLKINFSDYNYV